MPMNSVVFRMVVEVPLPADDFERAEVFMKLKPAVDQFRSTLPDGYSYERAIVTKRPAREKAAAAAPAMSLAATE
jgi:hypothetical protein